MLYFIKNNCIFCYQTKQIRFIVATYFLNRQFNSSLYKWGIYVCFSYISCYLFFSFGAQCFLDGYFQPPTPKCLVIVWTISTPHLNLTFFTLYTVLYVYRVKKRFCQIQMGSAYGLDYQLASSHIEFKISFSPNYTNFLVANFV